MSSVKLQINLLLLWTCTIFVAENVEGFGCLQPRKKMLKLRYGAFRSPSGFIKSPLFSWELRSFFLQ